MAVENVSAAIEAILFASGSSVEVSKLAQALEVSTKTINEHISQLINDYTSSKRGITIIKLDEAYQMVTVKEYAEYIRKVMDLRRNTPLSQAALEVLAVVAYNQPVTKAFVEQVRGVDCSGVLGSLTTKGLIEEKGRLELPGRPLLYGTTENFLRCFNIETLEQLPPLPENDDVSEKGSKSEDESIDEIEKTVNINDAENSEITEPDTLTEEAENIISVKDNENSESSASVEDSGNSESTALVENIVKSERTMD